MLSNGYSKLEVEGPGVSPYNFTSLPFTLLFFSPFSLFPSCLPFLPPHSILLFSFPPPSSLPLFPPSLLFLPSLSSIPSCPSSPSLPSLPSPPLSSPLLPLSSPRRHGPVAWRCQSVFRSRSAVVLPKWVGSFSSLLTSSSETREEQKRSVLNDCVYLTLTVDVSGIKCIRVHTHTHTHACHMHLHTNLHMCTHNCLHIFMYTCT